LSQQLVCQMLRLGVLWSVLVAVVQGLAASLPC
jgi:hypothetical protein